MQSKITGSEIATLIVDMHKLSYEILRITNEPSLSNTEKFLQYTLYISSFEFSKEKSNIPMLETVVAIFNLLKSLLPKDLSHFSPTENVGIVLESLPKTLLPVLENLCDVTIDLLKSKTLTANDLLMKAKNHPVLIQDIFHRCYDNNQFDIYFTSKILQDFRLSLHPDVDSKKLMNIIDKAIEKKEKFYQFFRGYYAKQSFISQLPSEIIVNIYEKYKGV